MNRDTDELIHMLENEQNNLRKKITKAKEADMEDLEKQLFYTNFGLSKAIDIVREWIN